MKTMQNFFLRLPFVQFWVPFCFFLGTAAVSDGQQTIAASRYRFISIGKEQGLEGTKPTCIFQDKYGFVWIGTWGGLYRFDGYSCKLFEHKPGDSSSIPSGFIAYRAFHEEPNGDLWIATFDAGFVKFDRKTERFQVFKEAPNRLGSDAINALTGDGKGGVWVGTRGKGLSHYFPKQDSFFNYWSAGRRPDTLMGSDHLLSLRLASDGRLWIGTQQGVAVLDTDGFFTRYLPDTIRMGSLSDSYVIDIFEDTIETVHKKGRIWVTSKNGLNLLAKPDSFVHFFPTNSPNVPKDWRYNHIQRVFRDSDGDFWLGTLAGLLRFDPERNEYEVIQHNPLDPASIAKGGVHGILEDNMGRLWFAADGGLSVLDKNTARLQDPDWAPLSAVLPSVSILYGGAKVVDAGGRIWLATDKGLFHFRPGQPRQLFKEGNFTTLFVDKKGRLFAGTDGSYFFIIDPKNLQVLEKQQKELLKGRSRGKPVGGRNIVFAEDLHGTIWMGNYKTLNRYNPKTKEYRQFFPYQAIPNSLSNADVNDLKTDHSGNLWIATMGGINLLTANELKKQIEDTALHFTHFRHNPNDPNSLSNDHVRVICEDSRGWMWFGTDAGLSLRYPDGRWQRFFKENGLPDNHITGIVEDGNGNIWLTTPSRGIAKYIVGDSLFVPLTKRDGLNSEQFPSGACLKMQDGRLLFVGVSGLNVIDPKTVALRLDSVPLYFVELLLFNQPVIPGGADGILQQPLYMTRRIEVAFSQRVLSFRFAALNFTNPEKQVYRYRVEGFSALENWQQLGNNREITLTNLFPGDYTLRVESTTHRDERAQWESVAVLIIKVKYPWVTILLYLSVILGVLYIIYKLRIRRKLAAAETRRLKELDAVKTNLYTNITHEFRTPLTVILGETAQLEKQAGKTQKSGLDAIRRQGRQLLNLVNQMLDLAKLESGSLRLNMVQGNVVLYLKYLLESFHSLADSKQIELLFETDTEEFGMDYDPDKLQKIVSNLLSNAIKFTPENGRVTLRVATGESLRFSVSDTGLGISPEKLPFVFDRFYQADDSATRQAEGTGIGLTLTKELVQLLGGKISVESSEREGSTFIVTLPVTRFAEKQQSQPEGIFTENQEITTPLTEPPLESLPFGGISAPPAATRPHLLLIEDNADVIRYLSSLLAADYQIHRAGNGREGLEATLRLVPDLIISDVMMPEMDGFELCRALKTDARSSHIPVVLLTAKADMDSRIEGLEHGADAYLAKPFEERELKVQLRKLHELRQALRERYSQPGLLAPSDHPAFRREDVFFQKLHSVLAENYSQAAFGVPELCSAMTMSRPNLFRKLTALTGKNIEDYLRSFRLQKAHELLRTTDLNVQEVAWDCGFNDAAHFTRVFHAEFGVNPSQIR